MRLDLKSNLVVLVAGIAMAAGPACGAPIVETEADGTATNNTLGTAQHIAASAFTLPAPASVFQADYLTATVQGSGGFDDVDFYRFFAYGGRVTIDMDNSTPAFDPLVALFDSAGTLLAYSDDSELDDGSANSIDSFLGSFLLPGAGYYFVAVSESPNFPTVALTGMEMLIVRPDGNSGGYAVSGVATGVSTYDFDGVQPGGASYTLHISAEAAVPEPGTLGLAGGAMLLLSALMRRHRQ